MVQVKCSPRSCKVCPNSDLSTFSGISDQDFKILDQCKTIHQYQKKQFLFYEGNPVLGIYCVRSGKVKLYKTHRDGKQQIIKFLKAGDLAGCSSLFSNEAHSCTAEVMESSEVCFLEKNGFLTVLKNNPTITFRLMSQLSEELTRLEGKVLDIAYKSARVRFAEFLLVLRETFGNGHPDGLLSISMSREEMAQAIGTTMETVVRLISEFREESLIVINKKAISIPAPQKLLEVCQSSY